MKEKLYTIELNDAVLSGDECCFCWLERRLEQQNLEFVLGSSYMESDIRGETDRQGFCRNHTKMMYDYGNSLGNAWILKSRLEHLNRNLKKQLESYVPGETSGGGLLGILKKNGKKTGSQCGQPSSNVEAWIRQEESHCYICDRMKEIYGRMLDTFAYQLKNDPSFCEKLSQSPGFCIHHFADVLNVCEEKLTQQEKAEWMPKLSALMGKNLDRMQEDINWLIEKYDYRNKDADWRQSKDALQRTMQKISGGHPADPVFQCRK